MSEKLSSASNCRDYFDSTKFLTEQKKTHRLLLPNSERKKRIQKVALDDCSTLDEYMLDSERQGKLLNEAKQLKHTTKNDSSFNSHTAVLNDSEDEALQLWLEEIGNSIAKIDEPDLETTDVNGKLQGSNYKHNVRVELNPNTSHG